MKKLFYIGILIFATSCSTNKHVPERADYHPHTPISPPEEVVFRFKKEGTSLAFNLTIFNTGKSILVGANELVYEKNIGEEKVNELIKAFTDAKFFQFEDEYAAQETNPTVTYIEFNHKGKRKMIKDYSSAPESLKALEKKLDILTSSDGWYYADD